MKKHIILLLLSLSTQLFSQGYISGIIIDSKTKEALPFASILINNKLGSISDAEGNFEISTNFKIENIQVSYIGYKTIIIDVVNGKRYYNITLNTDASMLDEVVLVDDRENPANKIIRQTIENKDINNPKKALESYKYNLYNKFVVTANPDSIRGTIDSVWTKKKGELVFEKIDSSNYNLKKDILRSHIYLSEKISKYKYRQGKGEQQEIMATRMAGFKEPVYELFAMNLQSFSFYDEYYTVMGDKYLNPIANLSVFKEYSFKILDTIQSNTGSTFMIYFRPKEKKDVVGLEGVLYINEHNFAVQKAIVELKAIIRITATMKFKYFKDYDLWFPSETDLLLRKGDNKESLNLMGNRIQFSYAEKPDSIKNKVRQNSDFDASNYFYMSSKNTNLNIEINTDTKIKNTSVAIVVDDDAHNKTEEFWNSYRVEPITSRGKETYIVVDSVFEAEGINKKLNIFRAVATGYYPFGYFDLNLNQILDYNKYEGFRIGIGGRTSTKLSSKFNVEAYGAYGFGDYETKGSVGVNFRLDKMSNTWIGASYTYDINPSSRIEFITDDAVFFTNNLNRMNNSYFNSYNSTKIYLKFNPIPNIKTKLLFEKSYSHEEYDYSFVANGVEDKFFDMSILKFGVEWEPYSKFMQTRHGRKRIDDGYPKFTGQFTKSFEGIIDGEYSFSKVDLRVDGKFTNYKIGTTSLQLIGGIAFGEVPIGYLYGGNPNSYLNEPWINRVNVAGTNAFETMLYGEFYSDKYIEFHVRHTFEDFKISDGFNPKLSLVSRLAFGSMDNVSAHKNINFKTLENGFFESGFEINSILYGFGIGTYYRYGANSNVKWDDNLFVKATYRISLF